MIKEEEDEEEEEEQQRPKKAIIRDWGGDNGVTGIVGTDQEVKLQEKKVQF